MPLQYTDLSFDPRDPYFTAPGGSVRWAIQVFTTGNGYGIDAGRAQYDTPSRDRAHLYCDRYALLGQQRPADGGEINAEVTHSGGVLEWSITVRHHEPVKAVKLLLSGLDPALLSAGWWAPNTPRGSVLGADGQRFQLEYPGADWATPWVAAGTESKAIVLSVRDSLVQRQILHVNQPSYASAPIVELVHVPSAPSRSTTYRVPPIRLQPKVSGKGLEASLNAHLSFVEGAHHLVPWETRDDVPAWLRDIALVVTLHGQHWTGYVFNTFAEMAEALRFVARHIDPARVLAYLPGWEGRYYHDYPRYGPGEALGGPAGFSALMNTAKQLGMRVMPMFGGNGANVTQYPRWERSVFRNDTNRYVELLNRPDWDSDRVGEGDQVFLNPGEPGFREHLTDSISAIVQEYGVDAAFLDTVGFWFNDPRFELIDGYRQLAAELRRRHPGIVLAAEGWWDALSAIFPLSQQWFGLGRDLRHPEVLTRYARTTGHLAEGTPGPGSTGVHELGFLPRPADVPYAGHIPVVSIADDTLPAHGSDVAAICRWAASHAPHE